LGVFDVGGVRPLESLAVLEYARLNAAKHLAFRKGELFGEALAVVRGQGKSGKSVKKVTLA
jgi:hypothetical protein